MWNDVSIGPSIKYKSLRYLQNEACRKPIAAICLSLQSKQIQTDPGYFHYTFTTVYLHTSQYVSQESCPVPSKLSVLGTPPPTGTCNVLAHKIGTLLFGLKHFGL